MEATRTPGGSWGLSLMLLPLGSRAWASASFEAGSPGQHCPVLSTSGAKALEGPLVDGQGGLVLRLTPAWWCHWVALELAQTEVGGDHC